MKKITLLFIAAAICSASFGQAKLASRPNALRRVETPAQQITGPLRVSQSVFNESFTAATIPPLGWTLSAATVNHYDGGNPWRHSTVNAYEGTFLTFGDGNYAVFDAFNCNGGIQSLITPILKPTVASHTLNYTVFEILLNPTFIDVGMKLFIEFSTNGNTWTTSTTNVLAAFAGYNTAADDGVMHNLTVDLSAYNGGSVQVRFRAVSDWGGFALGLDNVGGVDLDGDTPPMLSASVESLTFSGEIGTTTDAQSFTVNTLNTADPVTATTTSPYSISADNVTYGLTATLPTAGGTIYVKYTPTSTSVETATVSLVSGTATGSVTLQGMGFDCNITLPLSVDFDNSLNHLCWNWFPEDAANNQGLWGIVTFTSASGANNLFVFSSFDAADNFTQYLVSPELPLTTSELSVSFDYFDVGVAIDDDWGEETFYVGYSTTTSDIASFTWDTDEISTNSDVVAQFENTYPVGTKYIAIKYTGDYVDFLGIDNILINREIPTALSETDMNNVSIYPNPSKGLVNIVTGEKANVRVFDVTGRNIDAFSVNAKETTTFIRSAGVYLLKVESNGKISTHKVIIQ
ncbi:hypothetical protein FACS189429_1140 [Bacteroidia bacterium]|nr:hypothetical protein FACS189429_1140 [Bacteroidia bacterium]